MENGMKWGEVPFAFAHLSVCLCWQTDVVFIPLQCEKIIYFISIFWICEWWKKISNFHCRIRMEIWNQSHSRELERFYFFVFLLRAKLDLSVWTVHTTLCGVSEEDWWREREETHAWTAWCRNPSQSERETSNHHLLAAIYTCPWFTGYESSQLLFQHERKTFSSACQFVFISYLWLSLVLHY